MLKFIKIIKIKKKYDDFVESLNSLTSNQSVLGVNYKNDLLEIFIIMNKSVILFRKTKKTDLETIHFNFTQIFNNDYKNNLELENLLNITQLGAGNNNKENTFEDLARIIQKYKNYFNISFEESYSILFETMKLNKN